MHVQRCAHLEACVGRGWVQVGVPERALHQLPHHANLLAAVLRVAGAQVLHRLIDVGHIVACARPCSQQRHNLPVGHIRPAADAAASLTLALVAHVNRQRNMSPMAALATFGRPQINRADPSFRPMHCQWTRLLLSAQLYGNHPAAQHPACTYSELQLVLWPICGQLAIDNCNPAVVGYVVFVHSSHSVSSRIYCSDQTASALWTHITCVTASLDIQKGLH
jgi:hypothetical protein